MPCIGVNGAMGSSMKYTPLGRTGVHVSLLGLGAMTFGSRNAWKIGGLNPETEGAMVKRCIDAGVNFFDTADVYDEGESERALGRALKPYREQVILATKVRGKTGEGINELGLSRHHMRIAIRKSLERLGTSWVDVYQFHGWDAHVPMEEFLETMQDLAEDGLVNYPGVSNFSAWQMATLQARAEERGYSRYETAQMNYSLLNRDIEHEVLPFLRAATMTLLVWSPLHGGTLSGKYTKEEKPREGTRMGDTGRFFPFFDEEVGWSVVDKVRTVAKEQGCASSQVALSWLLKRKHVVLLGARSMEQLDEDLGSLDVHLTAKQDEELDALTKPRPQYPAWMIQRQDRGRAFPIEQPD